MYTKDDEGDTNSYRKISVLSVPSKIVDRILCIRNCRSTSFPKITWLQIKKWALTVRGTLLNYCSYTSRKSAIDTNKVVAVAFVDFRRAFDSVSHAIKLHKLNSQYGVQG